MPSQTVGAGGGKAARQYSGNLYKIIRPADLQHGPVFVADHLKVDSELNQIFNSIGFADPTVTGSQSNGNMGGAAMVQTTTPSATGVTAVIAHGLGRIPVGFISVGPLVKTGGNVTWQYVQAPDSQNLYLKIVHSEDVSVVTSLIIW